jgi:hypothetical protein
MVITGLSHLGSSMDYALWSFDEGPGYIFKKRSSHSGLTQCQALRESLGCFKVNFSVTNSCPSPMPQLHKEEIGSE